MKDSQTKTYPPFTSPTASSSTSHFARSLMPSMQKLLPVLRRRGATHGLYQREADLEVIVVKEMLVWEERDWLTMDNGFWKMTRLLSQAMNPAKAGMILNIYAPTILALATSGKIAPSFTSGKSSNEGHLHLTLHHPAMNKTKNGRQRIPKQR